MTEVNLLEWIKEMAVTVAKTESLEALHQEMKKAEEVIETVILR
jgi:hypothetical protein